MIVLAEGIGFLLYFGQIYIFGQLFTLAFLHFSLQYLTLSQTSFHFLRYWNGRAQFSQILVGKLDLKPLSLVDFSGMDLDLFIPLMI